MQKCDIDGWNELRVGVVPCLAAGLVTSIAGLPPLADDLRQILVSTDQPTTITWR